MTAITRDVLMQNAARVREAAAKRADETEQLRQLPEATVRELIDGKLFSIVAPKQHNGLEMDIDVLLEAAREVGKGCGSTAWVLSLLGTHNWMGGLFPEQAQQELFGDKGYLLAPATFAPSGTMSACEGGFRVNGCWKFGSGVMHSDWVMVSALEEDDQANMVGMRCIALPIADVTIADNWHTSGMRGTGSNDIVIQDAFVPTHRTIPFFDLLEGTTEGGKASANPVYRLPLIPYLAYTAAAPALGMGRGAVDAFSEYLKERVFISGDAQKEKPAAQMRLAEAHNEVSAAEALVERGVQDMLAKVKSGEGFAIEDRVRYRSEACYAATLVKRAIDRLCEAAGARAQFKHHSLQRFQRDINTLRGHVVFDLDTTMELQGRVLIGMPPNQPLV